jgi:hypothetical protein
LYGHQVSFRVADTDRAQAEEAYDLEKRDYVEILSDLTARAEEDAEEDVEEDVSVFARARNRALTRA